MKTRQKDIIKKLYLLWETDRLHILGECFSTEELISGEKELDEMKQILFEEFGINLS